MISHEKSRLGICRRSLSLDQTTHSQVLLNDDVVDGSHDKANLHGIGSAGEVGIDLLALMVVERDKAVEDVLACRIVVGAA
jgi:hypothetical protein